MSRMDLPKDRKGNPIQRRGCSKPKEEGNKTKKQTGARGRG